MTCYPPTHVTSSVSVCQSSPVKLGSENVHKEGKRNKKGKAKVTWTKSRGKSWKVESEKTSKDRNITREEWQGFANDRRRWWWRWWKHSVFRFMVHWFSLGRLSFSFIYTDNLYYVTKFCLDFFVSKFPFVLLQGSYTTEHHDEKGRKA